MSPEEPDFVVKLFNDEQQFLYEKTGYDKVIGEPNLLKYANPYRVIAIHLDTSTYPLNRKEPPFIKALLIPFLSNPPWKKIGKLACPETDNMPPECKAEVEKIKNDLGRIGLAPWEATFFIHSNSRDIKVIDFTYSKVVFNNYVESKESE